MSINELKAIVLQSLTKDQVKEFGKLTLKATWQAAYDWLNDGIQVTEEPQPETAPEPVYEAEEIRDPWQGEPDMIYVYFPKFESKPQLLLMPAVEVAQELEDPWTGEPDNLLIFPIERVFKPQLLLMPATETIQESIEEVPVKIKSFGRISGQKWVHEPKLSELPEVVKHQAAKVGRACVEELWSELKMGVQVGQCAMAFCKGFVRGLKKKAA